MSIGYACLTVGVENTDQKSCMLKNASESRLSEIVAYNLSALENIIDYNIKNQIKLFRISSDLIPFGSSPMNTLHWWDVYRSDFSKIGEKIKKSGMRVSMHPGQYTVLNSPREEVVERAIQDLNYHARVLDCLGVGPEHKIVLHIGGIYDDKKEAMDRFIRNYQSLEEAVKKRLVIENDDKSYTISDVLEIGAILNIPVIFDNLHNEINPSDQERDELYWIGACRKTWEEKDGNQKIHYSQQNPEKRAGSHSESIGINEFMVFYQKIKRDDLDMMLEVKDKNLSAVKCINSTSTQKKIKALELEWSKYKYTILETSPVNYLEIRKILKDKDGYPAISFYTLVEEALQKERTIENAVNAAQHVWGYFKDVASEKEKQAFLKNMDKFIKKETSIRSIKRNLWKLAVKYKEEYLLSSYYFVL
ncbi:UV-endonuclease UvdE [Alkaliphilus metalliredigens QYMF]|uniref:UV-endonuclease UvdE n=1 Tax=Alkaliphilus metalliredigens (strain QYMF) TaxID=293826 RepID=A6TJK2_ALKMQ|nr:UV DNA damage repair endonuclease UvsE [Alkaliphilus metalliredigens]ABR46370.1 UV-endonuclease UvdE [Alkaliphilus metalliredigens QYMF]